MKQYRKIEKDFLGELADLSLNHGQIDLQITEKNEDGSGKPSFLITRAPDAVLRGIAESDLVESMELEYGILRVQIANPGVAAAMGYQNDA